MATSSTKQALLDTLGSGKVEYESHRGVSAGQVQLVARQDGVPAGLALGAKPIWALEQCQSLDLCALFQQFFKPLKVCVQAGVAIAYAVFLFLWIYSEFLERRKRYS